MWHVNRPELTTPCHLCCLFHFASIPLTDNGDEEVREFSLYGILTRFPSGRLEFRVDEDFEFRLIEERTGRRFELTICIVGHECDRDDAQSIKSHPDRKKTPNATLSHSTHLHSPSNPPKLFLCLPPTHLQILFFSYYFRWNELVSLFLITVNEAWPQNSSFIVRVDVDFLNSFVFFNFVVDPWLRSEEREILSSPRKWLLYANEIFVGLKKRLQPRNQNGNMKKEKLLHMMIPRMAPLSFSLGICFFSRFKHENSHWYLLSTHFVGAIFDKLIIHLLWVLIGTPSYKKCLKVET